eukprot:361528-Chlamydomonas_euryale.AAC.3
MRQARHLWCGHCASAAAHADASTLAYCTNLHAHAHGHACTLASTPRLPRQIFNPGDAVCMRTDRWHMGA